MLQFRTTAFLLTLSVLMTSLLLGQEKSTQTTSWILNGGDDCGRLSVGNGKISMEAGLMHLTPTGTDVTVTLPVSTKNSIDAQALPYFAFRYKYKSKQNTAGLFFTTDTLTSLSDKSYSLISVIPDNTWRNAVVDMRTFSHQQWKGKITAVRFDPTNPSSSDDVLQISRLGFFPTKEKAEEFLKAAVDKPDYSEESVFRGTLQRVIVPGNCLYEGYVQEEFMLVPDAVTAEGIRCDECTVVSCEKREDLKGGNGAKRNYAFDEVEQLAGETPAVRREIVPVCITNRRGFTNFVARKAGKYTLEQRQCLFTDLPEDSKLATAIRFVVARELMGAFSPDNPTLFEPEKSMSQDEWMKLSEKLKADNVILPQNVPATRKEAACEIKLAIEKLFGVDFESPYTNQQITRDRIRIGAWTDIYDSVWTPDFIKTYSEGGFDWIIAHSVNSGATRDAKISWLLKECDKYGVELILGDNAFENPRQLTAEYFDHPCFSGTYVTDEPGTESYDKLAEICKKYTDQTGGKIPYINLLPMYANAAQLKYGASAAAIEYYDSDPELFKKYCDQFCEKFNVPYICTDIYPLNWVKGKRTTYPEYVESINIIARSAREHNKDFWCCLQTFGWIASKRTPTESEFRWQAYTLLSFGCKGLLCWRYVAYRPDFPALMSLDGKRTNAWYDAAKVFKEIRCISDAFVQYRNLGAFTVNESDKTPYLKMSNPLKEFKPIEKIDCPDPLLIGCFEKQDGYAFTVVNMSELEEVKTITVRFKLADGQRAVAWPQGHRTELKLDSNGFYSLTLPSGEGVFVEILPRL